MKKPSQLFVWGFDGTSVSGSLRKFFRRYRPGGVILFARNIESLRQVRSLTKELQALSESPLLIGIDEEGGRVTRLPPPFPRLPPAAEWGEICRRQGDTSLLFHVGRYLAQELLSVGINTDFAPVLDVNSNRKNPIIGDRAFSPDPRIAAKAAVAFYLGMKKEGLIACGKHFPGHGDTSLDSHRDLPYVARDTRGMEKIELFPFRAAIRQKIPMLMTAHVVYEALDKRNPATLSPIILQDLLRRKMRFGGVVITDDLQMKAISKTYSEIEASILSLSAGCDLLLICQAAEEIGEDVVEGVSQAVESSPVLKKRLVEALRRNEVLRPRFSSHSKGLAVSA